MIEPRQAEIDAFLAEHFPEPKIENRAGTASNGNGHLSDHEIFEIGLRAKNGDKLRSLLAGNCGGYPSASEAEMALCSLLAFYTQDESQIDRLYRGSKLVRDKWDEKHYGDGATYGERTIEKAISSATEIYSGKAEGDKSLLSLKSRQTEPSKPTLAPEALHGLAGEFIKTIEPYTEADPVAVLITFLVSFGNVIGRFAHFTVEETRHYLNLFAVLVGITSKGRKGLSGSTAGHIFERVDEDWSKHRKKSGLSSGEGLINEVRDERYEERPIKDGGRVTDYERVRVDEGVADKRLLVFEEEFSQGLKTMIREGNILSSIIRQAWDSGSLSPMTKHAPIKATGAHISIIGHITKNELQKYLTETEQCNGYANRLLWFVVERSKKIPNPTGTPRSLLDPLITRLCGAVEFAKTVTHMKRDSETEAVWGEVYNELSEGKEGLVGAITSRGEAQSMRLACIYALLAQSSVVRVEHLNAALALWEYSEGCAQAIFGTLSGDPTVDRILLALEKGPMSETEIRDLFGRHKSGGEIDRALGSLVNLGKAKPGVVVTGGRPKTSWQRCDQSDKSDQR
jgi:hypothetical protein